MTRSPTMPALAVVLAAMIWGCWWIPVRALDARGLDGPWAGLALYAVAAAGLLPSAIARRWPAGRRGRAALLIGLAYGVQLATYSYGVVIGNVMRVTLLYYLLPIWGTLFAVLALGERLTAWRAAAVALGLAGAVVVLGGDGIPIPRSLADWLGLATGVFFALAMTLSRTRPEAGGFATAFATFASAAAVRAGFALLAPSGPAPTLAMAAGALPMAAAFAAALAIPSYALVIWAAGRMDPGRISILLLLEVVAAALSTSILSSEPLGARRLAGCALILGAGVLNGIDQMRARGGT